MKPMCTIARCVLAGSILAVPALGAPSTTLVSATLSGAAGNGPSISPSVSADGRYVAFFSWAGNLVSDDQSSIGDIFVREVTTGGVRLISKSTAGVQANAISTKPAISANGRYVAFQSTASNLVSGDTNGKTDIFVRDLEANVTTRVSVSTAGAQASGDSLNPAISADGRFVAFESDASDLVPGDTNAARDIFVRDTVRSTTSRVSVASNGAEANNSSGNSAISADGRIIAFQSGASNLSRLDTNNFSDIYVRNTQVPATVLVSRPDAGGAADGPSYSPAISADGNTVVFESLASNLDASDTNGFSDIYSVRLSPLSVARVSVSADGVQGNGDSTKPKVSADGTVVSFHSTASNLVPGDTNGHADIFARRASGAVRRVSVASSGAEGNGVSETHDLSGDGRMIVFDSGSSNLVSNDENGVFDVFLYAPFDGSAYPYILAEAVSALLVSGGLERVNDVDRMNLENPPGRKVNLLDAAWIARKASGVLPNP